MALPGASEAVALAQADQLFEAWKRSPISAFFGRPDRQSFHEGFLAAVKELEPVMARMSLRRNLQNWVSETAALRLVCAAMRYDTSVDVECTKSILTTLVRHGVVERREDEYRWRETT